MKRPLNLEQTIGPWLEEAAAPRTPPYVADMLVRIEGVRQRPAWMVPVRWLEANPATGSWSTLRRAAILATVLLLTLALAGAALVGSGILERSRPIGTLDVVATAPWQAEPMAVGSDIENLMDAACLAAIDSSTRLSDRGRITEPVRWWIDVRGGQLIVAMYGEEHVLRKVGQRTVFGPSYGSCWAMVKPGEAPVVRQFGYSPPAAGWELESNAVPFGQVDYGAPADSHPEDEVIPGPLSHAAGRVSPDVRRVRIVLESGERVEATVGYGWYGAWWPARGTATDPQFIRAASFMAFDNEGREIDGGPLPTPLEFPEQ